MKNLILSTLILVLFVLVAQNQYPSKEISASCSEKSYSASAVHVCKANSIESLYCRVCCIFS